jgi:hypothetical protein
MGVFWSSGLCAGLGHRWRRDFFFREAAVDTLVRICRLDE